MKIILTLVLVIFLIGSTGMAQGEYFGKGNSGFGPVFSMGFSDGNSATGVGFGISNNGIVDFNFLYSSGEIKRSFSRSSTESAYSVGINTHLVNQQYNPFKLSTLLGVTFYKNTHVISILPVIHLDGRLSKSTFLKFYGGFGVGFLSEKSSNYYSSDESYSGKTRLQGGLTFYSNSNNRTVILFDIGVASFNSTTSLNIGLGLFFGSKNNSPLPEKRVLTKEEIEKKKKKRKGGGGYYGG